MHTSRPIVQPKKKILGFSGSPRVKGNSDIILQEIVNGVASYDLPTETANLTRIDFKGCIGCEKCRKEKICTGIKDEMTPLYPKLIEAQGLILVCPTHNYNITSWMKAFIDRMYCFYNFQNDIPRSWSSQLAGQNRKAVIAAICEQENKKDMGFTLEAMREPLIALGYEIVYELAVYRIFDKGKVKTDPEAMEKAFKMGEALAVQLG